MSKLKYRSNTSSSYKDFREAELKKKELKNRRQVRLAMRENKRYNEAMA